MPEERLPRKDAIGSKGLFVSQQQKFTQLVPSPHAHERCGQTDISGKRNTVRMTVGFDALVSQVAEIHAQSSPLNSNDSFLMTPFELRSFSEFCLRRRKKKSFFFQFCLNSAQLRKKLIRITQAPLQQLLQGNIGQVGLRGTAGLTTEQHRSCMRGKCGFQDECW